MKKVFLACLSSIAISCFWACGDESSTNVDSGKIDVLDISSDSMENQGDIGKLPNSSTGTSSAENPKNSSSASSADSGNPNLCEALTPECGWFESSSSKAPANSSDSDIKNSGSSSGSDSKTSDGDALWTFYNDPDSICVMTAELTEFPDYNFTGLKGTTVCTEGEMYYAGATKNVFDGPTDISSWGGLCVAYESSATYFRIGMIPDDAENFTKNSNYVTYLSKTEGVTVVDIPWEKFVLMYPMLVVEQEEFLKRIIGYSVQMEEPNSTSDFTVYKIGKMGSCGTPTEGNFYYL